MVPNALIQSKECFMLCILMDVKQNINYYSRNNLVKHWDDRIL